MSDLEKSNEPSERYRRMAQRYPELLLFPDDATRKKVWQLAVNKTVRSPIAFLLMCGFVMLIQGYFSYVVPHLTFIVRVLPGYLIAAIGGGIGGGLGAAVILWFGRNKIHRFLRQQLLEMRIPVCMHCGYDLRGQEEARCPECGQEFDAELVGGGARGGAEDAEKGKERRGFRIQDS